MPHLYYVYHPLCSWCWLFHNSWLKIEAALPSAMTSQWVMAPQPYQPNEPKTTSEAERMNHYWQKINAILCESFQHNNLNICLPDDPNMILPRAILCARMIGHESSGKERLMRGLINEVQKAFYCQRLNPLDPEILVNIVENLGISLTKFTQLMTSDTLIYSLKNEFRLAESLFAQSEPDHSPTSQPVLPSLIFEGESRKTLLPIEFDAPEVTIRCLQNLLVS